MTLIVRLGHPHKKHIGKKNQSLINSTLKNEIKNKIGVKKD
jgi:hypothetical protein